MDNFVSVIFCRNCGSRYVEISDWSDKGDAIIKCRSCKNQEEIKGFTLGHCSVKKTELEKARDFHTRKGEYEK